MGKKVEMYFPLIGLLSYKSSFDFKLFSPAWSERYLCLFIYYYYSEHHSFKMCFTLMHVSSNKH